MLISPTFSGKVDYSVDVEIHPCILTNTPSTDFTNIDSFTSTQTINAQTESGTVLLIVDIL